MSLVLKTFPVSVEVLQQRKERKVVDVATCIRSCHLEGVPLCANDLSCCQWLFIPCCWQLVSCHKTPWSLQAHKLDTTTTATCTSATTTTLSTQNMGKWNLIIYYYKFFKITVLLYRSQDSIISIMTRLQAEWPWKCGCILGYRRDCSVLPKQTGSGA